MSLQVSAMKHEPLGRDVVENCILVSTNQHTSSTTNMLAEDFCIITERALDTVKVSTQRGITSETFTNYKSDLMFQVKHISQKYVTGTLRGKKNYLQSNVATKKYSHKCSFTRTNDMSKAFVDHIWFIISQG